MSDLADRAGESRLAVEGAGGRFGRPAAAATGRELPACGCGGRPVYRARAEGRFGRPTETLECPACGNAVGPYTARHQLAQAWRLWGSRAEKCASALVR